MGQHTGCTPLCVISRCHYQAQYPRIGYAQRRQPCTKKKTNKCAVNLEYSLSPSSSVSSWFTFISFRPPYNSRRIALTASSGTTSRRGCLRNVEQDAMDVCTPSTCVFFSFSKKTRENYMHRIRNSSKQQHESQRNKYDP